MRHTKSKSDTVSICMCLCWFTDTIPFRKRFIYCTHAHATHHYPICLQQSTSWIVVSVLTGHTWRTASTQPPPSCWFPPSIPLINTSGVSSSIIMMKAEGRLSKFPYKGPNSTSSSFAVEYLPGEPSHTGALWLKRPPPPAPPTPPYRKHIQKTHMQSRHTDPNSVEAHERVIYLSWTPVHAEECLCSPIGSPSQSDMVREERTRTACSPSCTVPSPLSL